MPDRADLADAHAQNRLILACLMLGVLLSPFSVSLVSTALPTIRAEYQVGVDRIALLVTGYFVPTVVLMPLFGRLGDFLDRQRLYLGGLLVFSVGALMSAFPPSFLWLLLGRVLQGVGWSGLYPLSIAIIADRFPVERQGAILGVWESAVGLAVIIGPPSGGLLIQFIDWRAIFLLLALVGIAAILFAWKTIPRLPNRKRLLELDWPGAITLTCAIVCLLVGLTSGEFLPPGLTIVLIATGLVSLAIFVGLERRVVQPFVHLDLLTDRVFMLSSLSAAVRTILLVSATVLVPIFLQEVRGFSPSTVGYLLVAYPIPMFLATPLGGSLTDRYGPRWPAMAGLALMAGSMYLLSQLDQNSLFMPIILALAVRGFGAGLCQTPLVKAAAGSTTRERVGMAAGLYGMIRYGGLAFGSAIAGSLLDSRLSHRGTILGNNQASVLAFRDVYWVLVFVGLAGIVSSWLIENRRARGGVDSPEP